MSGQPSTLIPSRKLMKNRKLLEARSTIYGCIASLFSDPNSEKFDLIFNEDFQQDVLEACHRIEKGSKNGQPNLADLFSRALQRINADEREVTAAESVQIFGHTLSKQLTPYELEHLGNEDVFFRTQKLADLSGFYRAFGLEVDSRERADHIATQSEFISFLLIKEALALSNGSSPDNVEVCHNARLDFLEEHFIDWVEIFSGNLTKVARGGFYRVVGQFLKDFISIEKLSIAKETLSDT